MEFEIHSSTESKKRSVDLKIKSNMERNNIILENDENVRVEGYEIFMQWILQNSLVLGLTGLSTLILGIILIRQIINGRNGFETFMAWLILGGLITYDYGIVCGSQVIAIGLQLILIGLFTLILISKILNIILTSIIISRPIDQSRLDFNRSQLIFDLIKIIIFAIIIIVLIEILL